MTPWEPVNGRICAYSRAADMIKTYLLVESAGERGLDEDHFEGNKNQFCIKRLSTIV